MERIIIYGAGKIGRQYYEFLKLQKMDHIIEAFCDRNYKQIGKIGMAAVKDYHKLKGKGLPFVIAVFDSQEICELLQDDGQVYYKDIGDWINDYQENDMERIKMRLGYQKMLNLNWGGEKNTLDNLNEEMYKMVIEMELDRAVRVYGGYCPCCKKKTIFVSYHYWLRDHYKCIFCNSIPRQRGVMKVLEKEVPEWKQMKIHESSPCGSTFHVLKQECKFYSYSFWHETKPLGERLEANVTNQNLEKMSFEDETFDIFITQDVLEHVNYPEKVLAEIGRTLKTGGIHIFTTPMYPFQKTRSRIKMEQGIRKPILPEVYHGNPIGDKGSLVTYDWGGYDFLKMVDDISGMESRIFEFPNSKENFENGLEGDFLQVVVSKKIRK